jgi:hypothetical protein
MKQKQNQISVNLDEQLNPNKRLLAAYDTAGARELFKGDRYVIPEYRNEERIFVASRTSKKPISHNLFSCYRKKVGSREHFFAFDHMITHEYFGSKIDHTRMIGKFEMPVIVSTYSINPSAIKSDTAMIEPIRSPPSIESTHDEYDYEWEAIKPQLLKWKEQNIINDQTNFYIQVGSDKCGKFSFEEWLNLKIEDLMLLARYRDRLGMFTNEPIERLQVLREQLKHEMVTGTGTK